MTSLTTASETGTVPHVSRTQAANAVGSVRAEGLGPGEAAGLFAAWCRGELDTEQLHDLSRRLLHDRGLTAGELLAGAGAAYAFLAGWCSQPWEPIVSAGKPRRTAWLRATAVSGWGLQPNRRTPGTRPRTQPAAAAAAAS